MEILALIELNCLQIAFNSCFSSSSASTQIPRGGSSKTSFNSNQKLKHSLMSQVYVFIMELCCIMLVLRNFLSFWKIPLLTDHEHNSMRARFCKYQGGGYSRCSTLSWWLENKFCLIWFGLLRPPPFTRDPVEWSLGHAGLLETPQAQREMMHVIVNTPDGVLKQRASR